MDQDNPVVKHCIEGMQAEGNGDVAKACDAFTKAWEIASDDFERCIAAHYVARHQETPEETLRWNEVALHCARAVEDRRVASFFPSLLASLGQAHEQLGNSDAAKRFYLLAEQRVDHLPNDEYGKIVRDGIAAGQQRLSDI